jgi:hypothetical protein
MNDAAASVEHPANEAARPRLFLYLPLRQDAACILSKHDFKPFLFSFQRFIRSFIVGTPQRSTWPILSRRNVVLID